MSNRRMSEIESSPTGGSYATPNREVIKVANVGRTFRSNTGEFRALDDITFDISHNQFVSLLGPSGCGKSTLLRIVAGLDHATAGFVEVEGQRVENPQTQLGVVFQNPLLLAWRTALENVLLQAEARKMDPRQAREDARKLLDQVGLSGSEEKRPHQLSGGMQQRVSICRALLHDPEILLMDEPFGALDALTRDQMNVDLLRLWERGKKTVIFVTHSIAEAVFLSDRVMVMTPSPGQICLDLAIELPRPRRLRARDTPEFSDYIRRIRSVLEETGAIHEDADEPETGEPESGR